MSENNKKNFMEALAKEIKETKTQEKTVSNEEVKPLPKKEDFKKINPDRPDSFTQETFTRIEKNKFTFNPKIAAIIAGILVVLMIISYFLFFAPKIVMPDFVGKKMDEFTTWATQYQIEKTGVAFKKEYNFEYDNDVIINQSITPNTKIKKDVKITITTSNGPDPDEKITFPDIKNMKYDEIQAWVKENKLLKTKVLTEFSTTVPKDSVISLDLKSTNENNFTRGTSVNIVVSKGEAPAGQVTVEEFTGKNYEEMRVWANNKKLVIEKVESHSDTVAIGNVISQSVKSGTALKQGDKIVATVSKGKAVKIPNLVGYTPNMLEAWSASPSSKVTVVKKEVYSNEPLGNVIAQSIPANSMVDQGEVLELTVSLYLPILQTSSDQWHKTNYLTLIAKVDEWNYKGANIAAGPWIPGEYSDDIPKGGIMEYVCADANGNELPGNSQYSRGCERPLPLNAKIGMKVSLGPNPNKPTPTPTPGVAEKQKGSIRFIFKVESTGETPVDLSGNSAEPELIIGEVGTSYSYTPPTINGYIYDKPEAGKYLNGIFSKESANNTENIILYYKKPTP